MAKKLLKKKQPKKSRRPNKAEYAMYFARLLLISAIVFSVVLLFSAIALRAGNTIVSSAGIVNILSPANAPAAANAITVQNPAAPQNTPPAIPAYTFGMWSSNMAPAVGQSTTIYARVSHHMAPAPNITVTITAQGATYAATTDADGVAVFTLSSNVRGVPVYIVGKVSVGGEVLTNSTFFTPY